MQVVGSIAMTVLAPHPLDPASFAPGSVRSIDSQRSSFVTFYDGLEASYVYMNLPLTKLKMWYVL